MDYGRVLSHSWRIVWQNKYLWVLGFLVALGSGGSGGGGGGSSNYSVGSEDFEGFPVEVTNFFAENLPWIILVGLFLVVLAIVFWLVRLVAEAGLIESVDRLDQGEKMGLGASLRAGMPHLGRLVGLQLLLYAPVILAGIVGAVLGLGALISLAEAPRTGFFEAMGFLAICLVPLVCVMLLYNLVITFVVPFAARGIVLERLGVTAGIGHGWNVLQRHLGDILVLAVIFLVLSIIVGVVVAIFALLPGLAALAPAIIALAEEGTVGAGRIVLAAFGIIAMIIVASMVSAVLVAYRSTVFTVAYREFEGRSAIVDATPSEPAPA